MEGPQLAGTIVGVAVAASLAVIAWQVATVLRARFGREREEAYRRLAEEMSAAQRRSADALAELSARLEAIEKLLREVG